MALDDEIVERLVELQRECAAQVSGISRGSGFFIDDHLLVTCEHVAGQVGSEVGVHPFGRNPRRGEVTEVLPGKAGDLALVRTEPMSEETPQPAVTLDPSIDTTGKYVAVGYPREDYIGSDGIEAVRFNGHSRLAPDGASTQLLVIDTGSRIVSGLSGAGVLSSESGAVVAVVQYAQDADADFGGGAIPIARAADWSARVKEVLTKPPLASRRWRDVLGRSAWKRLGKSWEQQGQVDLQISGDQRCWQVELNGATSQRPSLTANDLSDELAEALFRWAMRQRVRNRDDVLFLGKLLSKAIFPPHVREQLQSAMRADAVLIRLRMPSDSYLFDVPWEFATILFDSSARHVATEERLALVRVAEHPEPSLVETAPVVSGRAPVLGVIVQPDPLRRRLPVAHPPGRPIRKWPARKEIAKALSFAVNAGRLELTSIGNPTRSELARALEPGVIRHEIVHYIGFGRILNGQPALALHDGRGDLEWCDAEEIFGWVGSSGARLLVVEFALPPVDEDFEDIPPGAFALALRERVNAVVFTRFPVHPWQWETFNTALYDAIAMGEPIETAVQRARSSVSTDFVLGDAAAFGWFTLITGQQQDMQIVSDAATAPRPVANDVLPRVQRDRQPDDHAPVHPSGTFETN